jgi:hypothetical protein
MNDPERTEGRALSTEQMGDQPRAQLLEDNELRNLLVQWKDIQAEFVGEPRKAFRPLMPSLPSSCSG